MKEKIKNMLLEKSHLDDIEIQLAEHGIDIIVSDGRNMLCVLVLSLLLNNFKYALLYLLILSSLRIHTGGWHASSEIKCFFTYQTMFLLFSFINSFNIPRAVCLLIMILSLIYIICLAPVEHKLNPLSSDEIKRNRVCCLVYCFVFAAVFLLIQGNHSSYSQSIALSFLFNVVLMELLRNSKDYRYYEN